MMRPWYMHFLMDPHMCLTGLSSSRSPQAAQATDNRSCWQKLGWQTPWTWPTPSWPGAPPETQWWSIEPYQPLVDKFKAKFKSWGIEALHFTLHEQSELSAYTTVLSLSPYCRPLSKAGKSERQRQSQNWMINLVKAMWALDDFHQDSRAVSHYDRGMIVQCLYWQI